jgi:tetratricopeptide (TPR) repeat protein
MSFLPWKSIGRSLALHWRGVAVGMVLVAAVGFGCRQGYLLWQIHAARAALSAGAPDRALAALRKVETLAGENGEVLYLLGRASRRAGRLEDVYPYLDRALQAGWPEADIRHQRYLALVQSGNFQQSAAYQNEVLQKGVDDDLAEEIYEARVKGFMANYDLKEALMCADYWLKWRPHARQARMWRAEIWERTTLWHNAITDYRSILEHDPHDFDARLKLADALLWEKDAQGALREYETCAAARPGNAAARLGRIKCLRRLAEAFDAWQPLLALVKEDMPPEQKAEVLLELGEMALLKHDYAAAADFLEQARTADSTNRLIYYPLSRAYLRLGKTKLADAAKRRGDETTKRVTRLSEIVMLLAERPQDADLRYEAGMLFFAEGAAKDGAAWLQTALRCDPVHRKTHAALADYYEQTGDTTRASHHRSLAEAPPVAEGDSHARSDLP